jgi:2'-5' RNA ligase
MKRRLFIAINLDPQARRAIGKIERDIEDAFGRTGEERVSFMPDENWHLTVSFLGTQDDADLTAIMEAMRTVADDFPPPDISFTEIAYAPQRNNPRMIWLKASHETSETTGKIKKSLEYLLAGAGIRFERESRMFSGHITLARFRGSMAPGDLPKIERMLRVICVGASIDLMESELGRAGATYTALQKFPFLGA